MRCGSRSIALASASIAGGNVAEKNRLWRFDGKSLRMRASSSPKPRSSIRSASSSTRVLTSPSVNALCASKSISRPGVATTMSAPPRKCSICGLIDTPPNSTDTFGLCARCWPKFLISSPTWAASSRVGTSTKARTGRGALPAGRAGASASCCSSGSAKAAVLPEPVCADASTSRPAKTAGIAAN